MKILNQLLVIVLMFFHLGCVTLPSNNDLEESEFKNPSSIARVHTWWHWIDGRITRDGITKDLESMKQQGVVQATILNVGMSPGKDLGVEQIRFNTEQWYTMFRWALIEANRLGITIGMHNCDGWSESGGPWISPEMSMKKFVFTKTAINRKQEKILLPRPTCETNFYRDVAVVAFKTNEEYMVPVHQKVSLNDTIDGMALVDGNPGTMLEIRKNDCITIAFDTATTKSKIAILHNFKGAFYFPGPKKIQYTIRSSEDGKNYKKICDFETNKFYVTENISFPSTKARFFQIELSNILDLRPWHHAALAELELLNNNEQPIYRPTVVYPLEKTASARIIKPEVLYTANTGIDPKSIRSKNSVIELTDKMDADGNLNWNIPDGNWSVIRFGYTTTGAENGPATLEGRGLECDKMDTAAVNLHFRNFPQKLIDHATNFNGNTFKFLMIDSWERGYQTWTKALPYEFEKRWGYSLIDWIPVLCGETIENTELSDGFLYDFRKTLAELLEQNYYKHFRDLCHQNKLELHGEVIYGDIGPFPPIDVLKTNSYMDMPMYEFWAEKNERNQVKYKPTGILLNNFPAYASIFYNKPVVGAEAYTGFAHYSESPSDLKLFGDQAYCSGINQMILHSYVHQPVDKMPGLTLGQHGSHFNRNNPWWQYAKGWIDYQSRVQYVLQKGKISADILYFMGDQLPQFLENKTGKLLPEAYRAIPCNSDILEKLTVENGKIIFSKEQKYSILILPDWKTMEFKSLQKIAELVNKGAIVYGEKPQQMFSLSGIANKKAEFAALTDKLWNTDKKENTRSYYGKGMIIWDEPIAEVLSELQVVPEFTTNVADSLNIMYIHKNTENADVFFVVNQQDTILHRECLFRTNGNIPEIWNPLTGEIKRIAVFAVENKQVRIPVTFQPQESLFFIFRKGKTGKSINKIELSKKQLFPSKNNINFSNSIPEVTIGKDGNFAYKTNESGSYTFTSNEGKIFTIDLKAPETKEIKDFKGKIVFHPLNHGKLDSVEISGFQSFTEFDEPVIKYFAGTAVYQIDFELPDTYLNRNDAIYLNLGNMDAVAEVRLNSVLIGNYWMPNTLISAGRFLVEKNHLEIVIASTCRNRIIGDYIEYGDLQNVWTSGPVGNFLNKKSILKPAGIMGPLQLIKYVNE